MVVDACERSVPVESIACAHATFDAPRQRLDGLLLASRSSSIDRADASGETGRACPGPIQPPQAPPLQLDRPNRVMHRRVPWRGVPLPRSFGLSRPDHGDFSFPHLAAMALLGFFPFAGLLPQPGGHAEQSRRLNTQLDISAGPGPRAVRAASFAPIDFRRGGPAPVKCVQRAVEPGMTRLRLLGFSSRLRSVSTAFGRGSILPWALPLAGLWARFCASVRARPRPYHQPPGRLRRQRCRFAVPYPLMGFVAPLRATRVRRAARQSLAACGDAAPPSPALQRIDGADALPFLSGSSPTRIGSLSEVLHRP